MHDDHYFQPRMHSRQHRERAVMGYYFEAAVTKGRILFSMALLWPSEGGVLVLLTFLSSSSLVVFDATLLGPGTSSC